MTLQDKLSSKTKTSSTTRVKMETKDNKPPAGAKIIEQEITTETEEIENGWLVTKRYNGRYIPKGSDDKYGNYYNYDMKWFSKEDPLTITVNDKELAEAFDDGDEDED